MRRYVGQEVVATVIEGGMRLQRRLSDRFIELPCRASDAPAIMLELDRQQREALDLPECGALTGGTALPLTRSDLAGTVLRIPAAPTSWGELVAAEMWPLTAHSPAPTGPVGEA